MPERVPPFGRSGMGAVVTVGTFDGMHRGHALVLERTAERGRRAGRPSIAVTFDPHPLEIVNPSGAPPLLTLWPEKLELFAQSGIDYVALLPFTPDLAALPPDQFVERVLIARYGMREFLIGHDHGFGRGRSGDVESLRMMGTRLGFPVEVVAAVAGSDGAPVSSTEIRRAIAHGDLRRAADGLGRRYSASGRVVRGEGRGRQLGYPTLNLDPGSRRKLLPPHGVYAVRVDAGRFSYGGMMSLGPRPTFNDERPTLEVHLFDTDGDWYGRSVRMEFVSRLRDIVKFSSPEALVAQLKRDAVEARAALTASVTAANLKGSGANTSFLS